MSKFNVTYGRALSDEFIESLFANFEPERTVGDADWRISLNLFRDGSLSYLVENSGKRSIGHVVTEDAELVRYMDSIEREVEAFYDGADDDA